MTWALEVPGVTRAWCVRRFMGPGTVAVFFMRDDQADPIPDAEQLAAVAAYIEPLRPVTADVYVLAPVQKPVVYTIRLTPDTSAVRAAVERSCWTCTTVRADWAKPCCSRTSPRPSAARRAKPIMCWFHRGQRYCRGQPVAHVRGYSMVVIRAAEHYAGQLQALLPPVPRGIRSGCRNCSR